MKKLIALSATVLVASLSSPMLHAEETGSGCGLGATVMEGKSGKGAHIAAVLINGLVIPNTTFMTTGGGLMGCDPTQTVSNDQATEVFVARNMDQLSTDIAQGGGEHLYVFAELLGIADEDQAAFQQLAQQNYDQMFDADADAKRVIESLQAAMRTDSSLSKYAFN
ncbi:MAG: DUF3015 domain-containing protein [Granulosicoccus sp.]|nr:DUF3015 domain-containing protein [Granulosicoccus sp.]